VRLEQFDPLADDVRLRACYEMAAAAAAADDPAAPPSSLPAFRNWWGHGWDGGAPRQAWLAAGEHGPAGCYLLELPDRENVTLASVYLTVPPARRRRGTGTALLAHCAARAQAAGRTALFSSAAAGSAGEAFARAAGAAGGLTQVRKVLPAARLTAGHLAGLRAEAQARAAGYTVLSWAGPAPGAYLDGVTRLTAVLADAPHEAAVAAGNWDPDRVRASEAQMGPPGFRLYTTAARHDESGELAALCQLTTEPERPGVGFQHLTAVARPHRGRRLGLLVKAAMYQWLAEAEPGLREISTWNAESNEHMTAVNDRLGFQASGSSRSWELSLAGGRRR
jgi:GNAT superfamily N-acetyltransferase